MIDSKSLLTDLQKQVELLEVDLAEQLDTIPGADELLRDEHAAERTARRTAATWDDWRKVQLSQIAVAWVLGTVFLRWSEDNGLIDPVLSGPGDRLAIAEDAQLAHYRRHPEHNDGDWLAEQFDVLRCTDAGRLLFDPEHNPMYWVPISHDAAKALTAFWRSVDGSAVGGLRHSFVDDTWDTRFLGDLYQDLSEEAKKRYALLQTPRFIERFILDRTLRPAIDEFGLDGLRLIDPACGSGHFLLGAFERLVTAWRAAAPSLDDFDIVRRSLASVHGVDVNPFAVAIARFRLLVAALREAGIRTLVEASAQAWRPIIGCKDSLLPIASQGSFELVDEHIGYRARWEDVASFNADRLLEPFSYHVVVGNPPYIAMKDAKLRQEYRSRYSDVCSGKYTMAVPFVKKMFNLAKPASIDSGGAGYVGQITSNAFTKRDFGAKLIENFFPTIELTHIVNSSGVYIPHHGTPTIILIGRARSPRGSAVRVVLGIRGEPHQPLDAEHGLVWQAIVDQLDKPGSESDWVSVEDIQLENLSTHPWVLLGGGGREMFYGLDAASRRLVQQVVRIGFFGIIGADDAMCAPRSVLSRSRLDRYSVRLTVGDEVRNWGIRPGSHAILPYDSSHDLVSLSDRDLLMWLWIVRTELGNRKTFSGGTYFSDGKPWYSWHQLPRDRSAHPWAIVYPFHAANMHSVLNKSRSAYKQTAPVVKLNLQATEGEYLGLIGALNSSTACFWLKQVCYPKGGDPLGDEGARVSGEPWEDRYEFSGNNVSDLPLMPDLPREAGRELDALGQRLTAATPEAVAVATVPDRERLGAARFEYDYLLSRMISEQEELDWNVYNRYGLLSDDEAAAVLDGNFEERTLNLGERAFEIVLARELAVGETESQWFVRHGSTPITEIPSHWDDGYRRIVQARIDIIEKRRDLALIERPECKRRWSSEPWEMQQERALRSWLLDRMETRELWSAPDANGQRQPAPQTVRVLADQLREDEDFLSVAALWAADALNKPDADLSEVVGALVDAEHVPFLAAYRYKAKGLQNRAKWEHIWELQRQEDAVAARLGHNDVIHPEVRAAIAKEIGEVPVPPKYGSGDFLRSSYWSLRGKLDVPKERFISYPAASRDGDGSLLLGWAGWDHRQQAQALAMLIGQRRGYDGWDAARVTPLLAGLLEVLPWVHQWHADIDPVFGAAPGDIYDGFLDSTLAELHLSRQQLTDWRPGGRVNVAPLPNVRRQSGIATIGVAATATARTRRARTAPDPDHLNAVLEAAATGPLSNEQIRDLTGLDAAGARALAQHLVTEGRLTTTGQRRGMRYQLA